MKYTVTELEPMDKHTRVFAVHKAGNPDYRKTQVWYSELLGRKRAWCTQCQGISAAMSESCAHARVVKRFAPTVKAEP